MFAVTYALRAFAFMAFGGARRPSRTVLFIGQVISPAIISILIVYCLRNTRILSFPFGLPELCATTLCALLHLWKRNPLISIIFSTIVYMALLQNLPQA